MRGQVEPLARTRLGDALFTTTQQRVLGFLYGQAERSFFANEIIRLTGSGSGAVQRELARLVDSGLVTSRSIGRQRHYQANTEAPIFDELRGIIIKTVGLAEPLRAALRPLVHRITLALVYGSIAKGTATAASDIDLLVVGDDLTLEDLYAALEPVEQQLGRKVSPRLYTVEDFARRRATENPFVAKVLSGATIKLVG
ncbi:MAG: nucleotidyltransferase domain-containing protein, partial [Gammaproteobacteria bacterium]